MYEPTLLVAIVASQLESLRRGISPEALPCPYFDAFTVVLANRSETKRQSYGEGTLHAEPLRDALAGFERPATVITESPDEKSHQAIRAVLASRGS